VAAGGSSRTALEDFGRDNSEAGAAVEKSSGSCPEGAEESCRDCEMFVRVGMAFGCFKANRDVRFRAISSTPHLRSLAPLPQEELLALKRTLAELGSIGRNLNQIARAANQGQLVVSPGRDDLTAMLRVCGTLRDSLKRVLLANLKSWEQDSP
jgi:hypothetical protein